jgi:hypothetical protein
MVQTTMHNNDKVAYGVFERLDVKSGVRKNVLGMKEDSRFNFA